MEETNNQPGVDLPVRNNSITKYYNKPVISSISDTKLFTIYTIIKFIFQEPNEDEVIPNSTVEPDDAQINGKAFISISTLHNQNTKYCI